MLNKTKVMISKTIRSVLSLQRRKIIFLLFAGLALSTILSPPLALLLGIIFAQLLEHPFAETSKKVTNWLLKASVVGLGFGMNAEAAIQAGKEGFTFTVLSILSTLILGLLLGKIFEIDKKISFLIAGGTAICGGSAIAALSPIAKANQNQISIALGVIFTLNSVALFVFQPIGHLLHLSPTEFELWCAIAIHDTSSVVGAASKYGEEALQIATTVKLARALWIMPLAFCSTLYFKNKNNKINIPYFIGLFILAVIANSIIPGIGIISPYVVHAAVGGLTLTLFLIGTSLSARMIKSVGIPPIIQGTILWIIISIITLLTIMLR